MLKITPEDIKTVDWFTPQKAAVQLTQIMQTKVAKVLGFEIACDHDPMLMQLPGKIIDTQSIAEFGSLPYRYVCTRCEKVLEPVGFK